MKNKVKIWSNYIFPFKYKNVFKAAKSVQLLKQVVNKDLYKNSAEIFFVCSYTVTNKYLIIV